MSGTAHPSPASLDFDSMSEEETMAFVEAFLTRLSYAGLQAVIDAAEAKKRDKREEERAALLAEFQERVASLGFHVNIEFRGAGEGFRNPFTSKYVSLCEGYLLLRRKDIWCFLFN